MTEHEGLPDHSIRGQTLPRRAVGLLALGAVVMRMVAAARMPLTPLWPDWKEYTRLANSLAERGSFGYGHDWRDDPDLLSAAWRSMFEADHAMFRPPGFPLLVLLTGRDPRSLQAVLALLDALMVGVLAVWVARRFGRRAGLWAGLAVACSPTSLALMPKLARETALGLAVVASVALLDTAVRRDSVRHAVAMGAVAATAAYVKETALLPVAAATCWLAWLAWRTRQSVCWRLLLGMLAGVAVVLGPWLLRNALIHGRPVGLTCVGFQAWSALGDHGYLATLTPSDVARLDPDRAATCVEASQRYDQLLRMYVSQHPVVALRRACQGIAGFWSPLPRMVGVAQLGIAHLLGGVWTVGLYACALHGAWVLRRDRLVTYLGALFVLLTFAHALTLATPRFRVPFEPLLWVLAAVSLSRAGWLTATARQVVARWRGAQPHS